MTPNDVTTILERLSRIEAKLDTHGDALSEIRQEVKKTNGRVTALETREREDRARLDERTTVEERQRAARVDWLRPIVVGIVVFALGAALVAGLNLDRL
jgi:hypothetical protein